MSRQDQALITLVVDGRNCGVFDARSGGLADSEEAKYRDGDTSTQAALGGPEMTENITVSRRYIPGRDRDLRAWLVTRRGKGKATVSETDRDDDGNPFGVPSTWTGIVKSVSPRREEADSNGSGDPAIWSVEISTNSTVAG